MEKHPLINEGQFTVQFVDRNTGHVLDQNCERYISAPVQKVFTVCDSLKAAIETAEHKKQAIGQRHFNVGYYIRNSKGQVVLHTDGYTNPGGKDIKSILINGANFSDEEGFYNETDSILTSELDWKTGHNLNALNDLLRGGFCVHEYEEPIQLVWVNSGKSKQDLNNLWEGKTFYDAVLEIIKTHTHIAFREM